MRICSTISLLFLCFIYQAKAQNFPCDRFNKGETQDINTFGAIVDQSKIEALISFYSGLRWQVSDVGGTKTITLLNNNPPKTGPSSTKFSRPVATTDLIKKHFPKSFYDDFRACQGTY